MKLRHLAAKIGAGLLTEGLSVEVEIDRVYAGDRVSDLLHEASSSTLLVTNLANPQLLRVAELMDYPAICFVKGLVPSAEILKSAREQGTVLVSSPVDLFETCGRLYGCLRAEGATRETTGSGLGRPQGTGGA